MGFSQAKISWYRAYLTNRTFLVNVEKKLSSPGNLTCGVPQGSILGPLIFLLYVNDMSNSVDCELLLYADDSCLIFTGPDLKSIEANLNKNFNSQCDWFVQNKLSIYFVQFGLYLYISCLNLDTKQSKHNQDGVVLVNSTAFDAGKHLRIIFSDREI